MLVTSDGKYDARLGMPQSSADELWRSLSSCSPRSTIAPGVMVSAFEFECGTLFDVQLSVTVVCNTPNPKSTLTIYGPNWALRKLYSGRNSRVM